MVRVSDAIRKRGSRKAKIALLGELLGECVPDELSVVVSFLVGSLPMGRIGVGPASVRASWKAPPSEQSSLSVADVVERFTTISSASGKGSKKRREDLLTDLMTTSTEAEQSFLGRLLVGELRQGAQTGVMVEAIAAAAAVPAPAVRRAAMLSGDLPLTAVAAFDGGDERTCGFQNAGGHSPATHVGTNRSGPSGGHRAASAARLSTSSWMELGSRFTRMATRFVCLRDGCTM